MVPREWRKARASTEQAQCVEVANTLGAVRDSKNAAGPAISGNVLSLVSAIRRGDLAARA